MFGRKAKTRASVICVGVRPRDRAATRTFRNMIEGISQRGEAIEFSMHGHAHGMEGCMLGDRVPTGQGENDFWKAVSPKHPMLRTDPMLRFSSVKVQSHFGAGR